MATVDPSGATTAYTYDSDDRELSKTIAYGTPLEATTSRSYDSRDIHRLRFLQRARGLGFSIKECRDLLELYDDTNRASADVRAMAQQRIEEIDTKIEELRSLRASLSELVSACHGDDRPDCPILDDLAGRKQ